MDGGLGNSLETGRFLTAEQQEWHDGKGPAHFYQQWVGMVCDGWRRASSHPSLGWHLQKHSRAAIDSWVSPRSHGRRSHLQALLQLLARQQSTVKAVGWNQAECLACWEQGCLRSLPWQEEHPGRDKQAELQLPVLLDSSKSLLELFWVSLHGWIPSALSSCVGETEQSSLVLRLGPHQGWPSPSSSQTTRWLSSLAPRGSPCPCPQVL